MDKCGNLNNGTIDGMADADMSHGLPFDVILMLIGAGGGYFWGNTII